MQVGLIVLAMVSVVVRFGAFEIGHLNGGFVGFWQSPMSSVIGG